MIFTEYDQILFWVRLNFYLRGKLSSYEFSYLPLCLCIWVYDFHVFATGHINEAFFLCHFIFLSILEPPSTLYPF